MEGSGLVLTLDCAAHAAKHVAHCDRVRARASQNNSVRAAGEADAQRARRGLRRRAVEDARGEERRAPEDAEMQCLGVVHETRGREEGMQVERARLACFGVRASVLD